MHFATFRAEMFELLSRGPSVGFSLHKVFEYRSEMGIIFLKRTSYWPASVKFSLICDRHITQSLRTFQTHGGHEFLAKLHWLTEDFRIIDR